MSRWSMEDGEEPDALCADCGDGLYAEELSTEGWERYGALLCAECLSTRITDEADEDDCCPGCGAAPHTDGSTTGSEQDLGQSSSVEGGGQ